MIARLVDGLGPSMLSMGNGGKVVTQRPRKVFLRTIMVPSSETSRESSEMVIVFSVDLIVPED